MIPGRFRLHPNYPNLFNPVTILRFDLSNRGDITLTVYDILGRQVRTLVPGVQVPGYKSVTWDGTDDLGNSVSPGGYLYRIQDGDFSVTRKMVMIR